MEEKQSIDFQSFLKDTYFANADISFKRMKEFCENPSDTIEIILFDNSIIQELDTFFPVLNIREVLGVKFDKICRLAVSRVLYNKMDSLLKKKYPILLSNKIELLLIVCLGMYENNKPKFHNAGKISKIQSELSRLKRLLQEQVEQELDFIDPDYYNNDDEPKEDEPKKVIVSHHKYIIDKIIVELKDDEGKSKPIKMNIYDKNEDSLLWEKAKLDIFFMETFEKALDKLNVASEYKKINTNHLFCQQFFNYINNCTAYSTIQGYSERQILLLFTDIYEMSGHKFPKTSDRIEMVEKWLKPIHK
ncbi:hypothetical protein [Emticicia sp. SJ17W-69]|uniref:hypothetical protein n=1 Tax=Emticicia sp. SJ17W-69 TaxID=3421657 RepID=UPI003EC0C35F